MHNQISMSLCSSDAAKPHVKIKLFKIYIGNRIERHLAYYQFFLNFPERMCLLYVAAFKGKCEWKRNKIWFPFLGGLTHDAGILQGKWLPIYAFHKQQACFLFYTKCRQTVEMLYNMQITLPFPNRRSQKIQTKRSAWNLNDFLPNPLHKGLFVASG